MNFWAYVWLVVLFAIFFVTYILNVKTPRPKGCENMSECSGCNNFTCSHHSVNHKEEEDNEH